MRRLIVVLALLALCAPAHAAPAGQVTWAVHFTLAPRWLDPAESEGSIPSFPYSAVREKLTGHTRRTA